MNTPTLQPQFPSTLHPMSFQVVQDNLPLPLVKRTLHPLRMGVNLHVFLSQIGSILPHSLDPLKTESPWEINHHKEDIKVRGRTANGINLETEEGGCIGVQAMDS